MKRMLIAAMFVALTSVMCRGQLPVIYAIYSEGDDGMVGNRIAEADDVKLSYTGEWDGSAIALDAGQSLTVSADEFQNICGITITGEQAADYLSKVSLTLTASSELKGDLTKTFTGQTCQFEFGEDERLSELTLTTSDYIGVVKVTVMLDVAPIVPSESVKIYADDVVPFTKRTNAYTYRYSISSDTDQPVTDPDEIEDFQPVPDSGITLTGKPDGEYMVYIDTPETLFSAMRHVKVSYVSNPATSITQDIRTDPGAEKRYDLTGRRIHTAKRGLQIITLGTHSKLIHQ